MLGVEVVVFGMANGVHGFFRLRVIRVWVLGVWGWSWVGVGSAALIDTMELWTTMALAIFMLGMTFCIARTGTCNGSCSLYDLVIRE